MDLTQLLLGVLAAVVAACGGGALFILNGLSARLDTLAADVTTLTYTVGRLAGRLNTTT